MPIAFDGRPNIPYPVNHDRGKLEDASAPGPGRGPMMTVEVDATYENGVLNLDHPLPLGDKEQVPQETWRCR
jgi:hypothetical protein